MSITNTSFSLSPVFHLYFSSVIQVFPIYSKNLSRQLLFLFIWKLLIKLFRFLFINQIAFRSCILSCNSFKIPRYQFPAQEEGRILSLGQAMITDAILTGLPETTLTIKVNSSALPIHKLPDCMDWLINICVFRHG